MIYVLPQIDDDNLDTLVISERNRIEAAKTSTYRIDSLKSIFDIDYMDLEYLLHYNLEFFNHCMKVADKLVIRMIRTWKLKGIKTLDDLLNSCDYFGNDYESRRKEFTNTFVENLWDFEEYFA